MQYCYCLFCETKRCKKVASVLEMSGISRAFSPQIVKRQRKNGKNVELLFDFLPGYIFAFTNTPINDVSLLRIDGVIRVLGKPSQRYCLQGEDRTFALNLLKKNGIIDAIRILRTGDNVMFSVESFFGSEGTIVQIDYRKQRAKVMFPFAGTSCSSWVACSIIDVTNNLLYEDR